MQIFINENQVHCKKCEYILDIHFEGHITHIWTKTIDGRTKHYPIHYHPRIYIAPPLTETIYQYNHDSLEVIAKNVAMHPDVISIKKIDCFLNSKSDNIVKALEVELYSLKVMSDVIRDLKQKNYYLYNIDINKRQHFFLDTNAYPLGAAHIHTRDRFDKLYLKFDPLAHRNELYRNDYLPIHGSVELQLDNPITMYDDINKIDYYIPPLKILRVDPMIDKKGSFNTYKDQLGSIKLQYGIYEDHELIIHEKLELKRGKHTKPLESKANLIPFGGAENNVITTESRVSTEAQLLLKLVKYIKEQDIDIILLPLGDKFTMNYLAHRAKYNRISDRFILGRLQQPQYARKDQKSQVWVTYGQILNKAAVMYLPGRIHLDYDNSFILYEGELAGVIDMTRMSATPMERTSRASIGTTLTGIEFVISQNTIPKTLVPENKVGGEQFKDSDLLLIADNGGLTYPAVAGVYDQVWAMDFTSLYPMIMMKHNVGSETVLCEHENCTDKNIVPELGYHICNMRESVVTKTMKLILSKRVTMKYMKKTLKEKKRADRYKGMDSALKWILVCCFEGSTRVLVRKNGTYLSERLDTIVNGHKDTDKLEALGMDEQGRPEFKSVKDVIKVRPQTPVFRIQFQGGETAVATADHLWPIRTNNGWLNVRTDQLTKDHWIPQLEEFHDVSNELSGAEIQHLENLEVLAETPMHFTRVVKVKQLEVPPNFVYCLQLDSPNPWFMIQGGIITHNCFGYLGFKNSRWGSIESHQCVTAYARRYLLQARLIVEEEGFEIVAGIVDSLFVRAIDPVNNNREKIEKVIYRISRECNIPMDLEGKFNWVVFGNVRGYAEVSALNRYFGYFDHGEFKLRGIRTRQRRVTKLELEFQDEVLHHLAPAETVEKFMELIPGTYEILRGYKQRLSNRTINPQELLIKIKTHVGAGNYKSRTVQALTAQAYDQYGRTLQPGQSMLYLVRNDKLRTINRIIIGPNVDTDSEYDAEWYGELLENALEELVGTAQLQHYDQIKYTDKGEICSLEDFDW